MKASPKQGGASRSDSQQKLKQLAEARQRQKAEQESVMEDVNPQAEQAGSQEEGPEKKRSRTQKPFNASRNSDALREQPARMSRGCQPFRLEVQVRDLPQLHLFDGMLGKAPG